MKKDIKENTHLIFTPSARELYFIRKEDGIVTDRKGYFKGKYDFKTNTFYRA